MLSASAAPPADGRDEPVWERPAPNGYRVVDVLNVLTHNLMGKGDDCASRLYSAGLQIRTSFPTFDIVGLNEYNDNTNRVLEDFDNSLLGCDGSYLREALYGSHSPNRGDYEENSRHRRFHYPKGEFFQHECTFIICVWTPEIDGGVGVITQARYPIVKFHEHECLGEDIAVDSDYTQNAPACQHELNVLRSLDVTADQLGVSYKLLLDDPGADNELDLDVESLMEAYGEANADRRAAAVAFDDCMADEIASSETQHWNRPRDLSGEIAEPAGKPPVWTGGVFATKPAQALQQAPRGRAHPGAGLPRVGERR